MNIKFHLFAILAFIGVSCSQKKIGHTHNQSTNKPITLIATPHFEKDFSENNLTFIKNTIDKYVGLPDYKDYVISTEIIGSSVVIKLQAGFPYLKNLLNIITSQRKLQCYGAYYLTSIEKQKLKNIVYHKSEESCCDTLEKFIACCLITSDTASVRTDMLKAFQKMKHPHKIKLLWPLFNIYKNFIEYSQLFTVIDDSDKYAMLDNDLFDSVRLIEGSTSDSIVITLNKNKVSLLSELAQHSADSTILITLDNKVVSHFSCPKKIDLGKPKYDLIIGPIDKVRAWDLSAILKIKKLHYSINVSIIN